jgi:type I restriction enzyme R subunit
MLNIMLSCIVPDIVSTRSKNKVRAIAVRLQQKASIPAVMQRMELIKEVASPDFWKGATIDRLEYVRQELRDIIKNILGSKREKFFIDISDTMEEKDDVEKPEMNTDYHTRILEYLNTHHDHPAIKKIYELEPLTIDDIKQLEAICWKDLGTKEEYEAYVKKGDLLCGDKVAVFIRSIIGIDRAKAKEMFSKFLSNNVLNSLQEEYLNQIIGYVVENGDITPDVLMRDSNLKELQWSEVFGQNLSFVGKYINEIHGVVQVANGEYLSPNNASQTMRVAPSSIQRNKAEEVRMYPSFEETSDRAAEELFPPEKD